MTWLAIGTPGGAIRLFSRNAAQAQAQLHVGEIIVPAHDDTAIALSGDGQLVFTVESLDDQKAAKWALAKAYRDRIAQGGSSTPLGRVQTDPTSYQRIMGAMAAAQASSEFSVEWTMADNRVVAHDAAAMIAMGAAVTDFLNACQIAGSAIRGKIEAAGDLDALATVDVTAGYPPCS